MENILFRRFIARNKLKFRIINLVIFSVFMIVGTSIAAESYPQTKGVTIISKNTTISKVINEIERQTGYLFVYNANEVNLNKKINVNIRKKFVKEALNQIFKGTDIDYIIEGKNIMLKKKVTYKLELRRVSQNSEQRYNNKISGVVKDASGEPIIGANVSIIGTIIGTVTDSNGKFNLYAPNISGTLSISYVGYESQELSIKDKRYFTVTLKENSSKINEVVVVAFGKQKKISSVGAVEAINPSDLMTTSSSLTTAFGGRIAGVISTQSSGQPGADAANFWIRGISTFGANSSPLLILDGVEINSQMLNSIAPETIRSFSILKDATATALYGSRGANGVMIITTKNGENTGKMDVNVRLQCGLSSPTQVQKIANGVTYMNAYNEAYNDQYGSNYYSDDKIEGTKEHKDPYVYPDNNWYKLLFRNYSFNQNANINVSGGSNNITYFLNAAITHENGMLKNQNEYTNFNNDVDLKKYVFQSNISADITSTTKISVKLNDIIQNYHLPYTSTGNLFKYTMTVNPVDFPATFPSVVGDDYTRYGNAPSWNGGATSTNPLAMENMGYDICSMTYLTAIFEAEQNLKFITKGLSARFLASFYNYAWQGTYRYYTPHYYYLNSDNPYTVDDNGNKTYNTTVIGDAGTNYLATSVDQDGYREYSLQGSLGYNRTFAKVHNVNAMLVYHQNEKVNNTPDASEYDVLPYRDQGFAGRLTYDYNERYLFEANFGYNGSENFAKGHRWGFFPSIAVGWNIANERFFSKLNKYIDLLKIRASWGKAGNDDLDQRFPYVTTVKTRQSLNFYYGSDITRAQGATISVEGNENATWEVSKKTNIGMDLGLVNGFTFIIDFFRDKRNGIFMQRNSIPSYVGYTGTTPYANLGAVTNQGIDFSMEYKKAISKDLIVTARGTFTYAHNKVTAKDEAQGTAKSMSAIGHPINTIFGLKSQELFKDSADVANSPNQTFTSTVRPGDIKYKDINKDNKIDATDETAVGYPTVPEIMYGFGSSIKYKGVDFSFYMEGTARVSLLMSGVNAFGDAVYSGYGLTQWIADKHWTASNPNPKALFPRLSTTWNLNNMQTSDYWVRNASYLRLKTIEVGYTFKNKVRVYLTGTNLLTFSPFKYWDPELGGGNGLSYPLQRTWNIGLQYNF